MTEFTRNINIIIATAGLVLGLISVVQAAAGRDMKKGTRSFFMAFFSVICLYVACILTRSLTYAFDSRECAMLSMAVLFGQAVLSALLAVIGTGLLLSESGEKNWKRDPAFLISALLWVIYVVMQIVNLSNGMLYSVNSANEYARGPYFALQMIPPVLIMGVNFVTLLMKRNSLTPRQARAFAAYITIPTICMLIQAVVQGIHLIALGTVAAAVIMYSNIVREQKEQYQLKEKESDEIKVDILLAQIKPHFLFNTLTTIRYLITQDPEKAEECTTAFMDYLRKNMDSLTSERSIPFSDELKHVKGFMDIQKIRFGDELDVEYDIEYEDFRIPSLILVPLVENAVSYGIRRNDNRSGTVTIRTVKRPDHVELIVEDDGPGFVPDALPDDRERSHIGINNVRERVEEVAGGELKIDSEKGKGTTATIILPLVTQEEEQ